MRVVLDTAALISALRSKEGAAAEVLRLAILGQLSLLLDYKLACEYRDVALRPEQLLASGRLHADTEELIRALEAIAIPVLVRIKHRPLSRDPNDDMVLDVAINGSAQALITNNTRDFRKAAEPFGIPVFTPREFLIAWRRGGISHADKSGKTDHQ